MPVENNPGKELDASIGKMLELGALLARLDQASSMALYYSKEISNLTDKIKALLSDTRPSE